MNKKKIERMLPEAIKTLKDSECKICEDAACTKILKGYRSAISSFGAAVTMGSFRAAVAFFSKDADKGDSAVSRSRLLSAMLHICRKQWLKPEKVCDLVLNADDVEVRRLQDDFLHASVALKLAMNAFELIDGKKGGK